MSKMQIVSPDLLTVQFLEGAPPGAKPFALKHRITGELSEARFWTRKAANHERKSGRFVAAG